MTEITITDGCVWVRYSGDVCAQGIAGMAARLASTAGFEANMPTIWDFTDATGMGTLTVDDLRSLAEGLIPMREGGGRPRVAVVTPRDVDFGVARMFEGMHTQRLTVDLRVFRGVAEARSWTFGDSAECGGT